MATRVAPINTYRMYVRPESVVRESKADYPKNDRRKAVPDRRQANSDRRKAKAERRRPDEKPLASLLQELRNSFSFLQENEQSGGAEKTDFPAAPHRAIDAPN